VIPYDLDVNQKGAAIRSTLQAIGNLYGDDVLAQVKGALRKDIRAQIEPRVLAVSWYPIEVSAAVHVAIRDVVGNGQWDMSHTIGIEAAKIDFNGVYRVFLRAMQYDTIWDRAQRAWDNYNSQGHATWGEREGGSAKGFVAGVTGFNRGIWNAVAGRFESLITLSGARGASVEVHDPTPIGCTFVALWLE
jgi:hypothetical protein